MSPSTAIKIVALWKSTGSWATKKFGGHKKHKRAPHGGGQKADGGQAGPDVGRAQGGAGGEKDSRGSDGDLPFSGNRGMEL